MNLLCVGIFVSSTSLAPGEGMWLKQGQTKVTDVLMVFMVLCFRRDNAIIQRMRSQLSEQMKAQEY